MIKASAVKKAKGFLHTITYCLRFTWDASHKYFLLRMGLLISTLIVSYVFLFISKLFIDALSQAINAEAYSSVLLVSLLVISTLIILLNKLSDLAMQYVQNVGTELLSAKMTRRIMDKSLTIDIAFFDSPDYLNMMQAVMIDSMSIINIVWNTFQGITGAVSLLIAAAMLIQYNWLYAVIIMTASIPMAIANTKFAKVLYRWRLDNMEEERKKSYIQSIASDKYLAFEVCMFDLHENLIKRYKNLYV